MKLLQLDLEKTYLLYKEHSDLLKRGECYNNCINVLALRLLEDFKNNKYKIGYCYVGGKDYQLVRHCVLIHKRKIIDLSALTQYTFCELKERYEKEDVKYYVFAELDVFRLHMFLNSENENSIDLKNGLHVYELEILDICKKNDYIINEYDYYKYIK